MALGADQALTHPRVLLTGASSQIGVFAIRRLLSRGFSVLAVSRNGKPAGWPALEQVRWLDEAQALGQSGGCRHLLSAGPLELAQKILSTAVDLDTAVVFSSSSVVSKQASPVPGEKKQVEDMLGQEAGLREMAIRNGQRLLVLKPTLIYGCGLDSNVSRLADWIRRFGFIPINGRANGLRQPVHAQDLADLAVSALLHEGDLPPELFLAGGETLTFENMVKKVFIALDKPARLVRLPQWLFVLLVRVAGLAGAAGGINTEMVRRQKHDLVFDDSPARHYLGYEPRSFEPTEDDFSLPSFD